MLVYSHRITNRVTYIFNVLLGDMMGLNLSFTSDREAFIESNEPKISYAHARISDELHFSSHGLLHETGLKEQVSK